MRLLHRYRVVRIALNPANDEVLGYYMRLRKAQRRRIVLRLGGQRDIGIVDVLTGRFVA